MHFSLALILTLSPTFITCFSLAFLRTNPTKNQGINWLTSEAVPDIESLNKCHPVPFGYFDTAQFIPDNTPPGFLAMYKIQKVYDPTKNLYWISIPGASVTKVEFYTGTDCKNAVYQQDEEGALRMSRVNQRESQNVRSSTMQLPQNVQAIPEEEKDDEDYSDFDIDPSELENMDQEVEAQSQAGNLGTTNQERMDIEPPVDGETRQEKISRQERNFLRFNDDVEGDGGIALDGRYITLQWSEDWESFKLSYLYVPTSRSQVTELRERDL
ncbi:hypothetical protein AOL_s00076g549 [Orbilia oligospora ATCC 24927]|uniref:Uncharacterized protein n=1 Tax=Arthrobotrys oligospora (strain ATCC 24927 / CBS 115.81 / DSM 1491) TaxID=756982 RepID=G1XA91_ARTOA|nr:hypothetical protein AOL_s00076g549 [Orbilia oligospora ATCC 24927]EGX49908.1 hypothetical protein AOL_s00076g549 [Orbilia oligospora ATCC 24927]